MAPEAFAADLTQNNKLAVGNDLTYYDNYIRGPNAAGSFLTPGHKWIDDLTLLHNYASSTTGAFWETAADGRTTDDERIEARRYNLQRFYTKFGNAANEAILGDNLASLSQYTLGTSLKGARYTRKFAAGKYDLTGLFGIPKASWDDLWNNNLTETVDRKFYGVRGSGRFGADGSLGVNAVWSFDSRARYNATAIRSYQRIESTDWAIPTFHGLQLLGESAFSHTGNDNPPGLYNTTNGWAHLVKGNYTYKRFKSQNDFERVSPEYSTMGGAASPDLIRVRTQDQLRFSGPWSLKASFSFYHNNLNHALGNTSTTRLPEGGFRYDGPEWRPGFSLESNYRYREVVASNGGLRSRTRGVASSVGDKIWLVDTTLDYEFQYEDKSDKSVIARHHILGLSGSSSFKSAKGLVVTPSVRWNLQRDHDATVGKADQTGVLTARLTARHPLGFNAGVGYSRNLVQNALNPNSDRTSLDGSFGWDVLKSNACHIEGGFTQNDNRFATPGKDFRENIANLKVKIQL